MKPEVKDRLVTGLAQYLSAQSAGSSRFAVSDGYLALDNYFSAFLLEGGVDPTRNHRKKLDLVLVHLRGLLKAALNIESDLSEFYDFWQKVRYSSAIPTPDQACKFLRLSFRVMSAITGELARRDGRPVSELEDDLYTEVLGGRWQSFDEECSYIHEMWQQEAEIKGEDGYGSKLGNKMLNPSNFCEIRALADDPVTREILASDSSVGSRIAQFYQSFLSLIVQMQSARHQQGVDANEIPNFMLSLRLRYHGQSMKEIAQDWTKIIASVAGSLSKRKGAL